MPWKKVKQVDEVGIILLCWMVREDVSVRVTLQHRSEEHWDIWVTRTSKYLPTHANIDPENRLSTFKTRKEASGCLEPRAREAGRWEVGSRSCGVLQDTVRTSAFTLSVLRSRWVLSRAGM